ncbi:unnamed protein product [Boreogadus saida]
MTQLKPFYVDVPWVRRGRDPMTTRERRRPPLAAGRLAWRQDGLAPAYQGRADPWRAESADESPGLKRFSSKLRLDFPLSPGVVEVVSSENRCRLKAEMPAERRVLRRRWALNQSPPALFPRRWALNQSPPQTMGSEPVTSHSVPQTQESRSHVGDSRRSPDQTDTRVTSLIMRRRSRGVNHRRAADNGSSGRLITPEASQGGRGEVGPVVLLSGLGGELSLRPVDLIADLQSVRRIWGVSLEAVLLMRWGGAVVTLRRLVGGETRSQVNVNRVQTRAACCGDWCLRTPGDQWRTSRPPAEGFTTSS